MRAMIDADQQDLFTLCLDKGAKDLLALPLSGENPDVLLFHHIFSADKPDILWIVYSGNYFPLPQPITHEDTMKYALKKNLADIADLLLSESWVQIDGVFDHSEQDAKREHPRLYFEKVLEEVDEKEDKEKPTYMLNSFIKHQVEDTRPFGSIYERYHAGLISESTVEYAFNVLLKKISKTHAVSKNHHKYFIRIDLLHRTLHEKREKYNQTNKTLLLDKLLGKLHDEVINTINNYKNYDIVNLELLQRESMLRCITLIGNVDRTRSFFNFLVYKITTDPSWPPFSELLLSDNLLIIELYFHPELSNRNKNLIKINIAHALRHHVVQGTASTDPLKTQRHLAAVEYLLSEGGNPWHKVKINDRKQFVFETALEETVKKYSDSLSPVDTSGTPDAPYPFISCFVRWMGTNNKSFPVDFAHGTTLDSAFPSRYAEIFFDFAVGKNFSRVDMAQALTLPGTDPSSITHPFSLTQCSLIGVSYEGRPFTPNRLLLAKGFIPVRFFLNGERSIPADVADLLDKEGNAKSKTFFDMPQVLITLIQQYFDDFHPTEADALFSLKDLPRIEDPQRRVFLDTQIRHKVKEKRGIIDQHGFVCFPQSTESNQDQSEQKHLEGSYHETQTFSSTQRMLPRLLTLPLEQHDVDVPQTIHNEQGNEPNDFLPQSIHRPSFPNPPASSSDENTNAPNENDLQASSLGGPG